MKKRMILMALTVLFALSAMSQGKQAIDLSGISGWDYLKMYPDTVMPNGDWQRVVESQMSAKESFKYAKQVLARIVPDYQHNVQLEDTTDNKITFTACLPMMAGSKTQMGDVLLVGTYRMTLTLVMKDGRYRIGSEGTTCTYVARMDGQTMDNVKDRAYNLVFGPKEEDLRADLRYKAAQLVYLIDTMLKKQKSDDDF